MFEPDGRNDIQYTGHLALKAFHYAMIALGVVCLIPPITYVYVREDLHVQEATIAAFRENAPVQTLVVDFNTPTFTTADVLAADGVDGTDVNPPATSLPFSIAVGRSRKDLEVGVITPQWVNSYLTFSPEVLLKGVSPTRNGGLMSNPPDSPEALRYVEGSGGCIATDRLWDWGDRYGLGVLDAKTVPINIAYIQASRAAATMRAFVTVHVLGWGANEVFTWDQHEFTHQVLASPAKGAVRLYRWSVSDYKPMPGGVAANYVRVYNAAFTGKLPVVVLHLQRLGDFKLDGADFLDSGAPPESSRRRQVMGDPKQVGGPSITGMVLGTDTSLLRGRPEFSYFDYLLRSAPCIDADSQEAVDALTRMTTFTFWRPLLVAKGITNAQDLRDAETTLGLLRAETAAEIKADTISRRSLEHGCGR